jgi:hypothetical protein
MPLFMDAHDVATGVWVDEIATVHKGRPGRDRPGDRTRRGAGPVIMLRRVKLPIAAMGTALALSACATGSAASGANRVDAATTSRADVSLAAESNQQDVVDLYALKRQAAALGRSQPLPGTANPLVAPDFTLAVAPTTDPVPQGSPAHATVTVGALRGFANAVDLSATGLPAGASALSAPSTLAPSPTSTVVTSAMTIVTAASTPVGTFAVTVHGAAGALQHSATLNLTVTSGPWVAVGLGPATTLDVRPGAA